MRKCPGHGCKYRSNNSGQMAAHLKANPHHEPGKTFKVYKGDKANQGKKAAKANK